MSIRNCSGGNIPKQGLRGGCRTVGFLLVADRRGLEPPDRRWSADGFGFTLLE